MRTPQLVHRVMIASPGNTTGPVVEPLLAARSSINGFNEAHGMRTAILHAAGYYVHWHEGSSAAIEKARHLPLPAGVGGDARVIHHSVGPATLQESVGIATLHGSERSACMTRRIQYIERQRALGEKIEPAQVWHWLSAPCRSPSDDSWATVAREDIVVMASEDADATDLVKAIGERHAAVVNYQRFAGADPRVGDTGAAYVDLHDAHFTTRAQAFSRRAVSNPLALLAMQQMHTMVLLAGNRPKAVEQLFAAVCDILPRLSHVPAALVVAADAAAGEESARQLASLVLLPRVEVHVAERSLLARADAVLRRVQRRASAPVSPT